MINYSNSGVTKICFASLQSVCFPSLSWFNHWLIKKIIWVDSQAKQRHKQINYSSAAREAKQHCSPYRRFDKVSHCPFLADIFHPFICSSFYFLALPEAQMTNTKAGSSLAIPPAAFETLWWKTPKKGHIYCSSHKYLSVSTLLLASFISVLGELYKRLARVLTAELALTNLWLKVCMQFTACIIVAMYEQGDLKRYLRAQRKADGMTPDLPTRDLLTLQRMAFEITSGLLHLHENNYIHRSVIKRSRVCKQDCISQEERVCLSVQSDWFSEDVFCSLQWSGFEKLPADLRPHCQDRRLWPFTQPL